MTDFALTPHPGSGDGIAVKISARLASLTDGIEVVFSCVDEGNSRIPPLSDAGFTDGLWRHTCCELFLSSAVDGQDGAYREFNFSPSGAWAIYDFSGYRLPIPFVPASVPTIRFVRDDRGWELHATLPGMLLPSAAWSQLGVTAVIEDCGGNLAYWALVHPAERPDFHDRRGFVAV
jgi:hypothetical protein